MFTPAGLNGAHHDADNVEDVEEPQEERDGDQADDCRREEHAADNGVQGHGELEIQRLLTLFLDERVVVALEQPDQQWRGKVGEPGQKTTRQPSEMTEHRPGAGVLFLGIDDPFLVHVRHVV